VPWDDRVADRRPAAAKFTDESELGDARGAEHLTRRKRVSVSRVRELSRQPTPPRRTVCG
jgi:hypothetical protein